MLAQLILTPVCEESFWRLPQLRRLRGPIDAFGAPLSRMLSFFPNSFSFRVLVDGSKKVPTNFSTAGPGQAWPNPKKKSAREVS